MGTSLFLWVTTPVSILPMKGGVPLGIYPRGAGLLPGLFMGILQRRLKEVLIVPTPTVMILLFPPLQAPWTVHPTVLTVLLSGSMLDSVKKYIRTIAPTWFVTFVLCVIRQVPTVQISTFPVTTLRRTARGSCV